MEPKPSSQIEGAAPKLLDQVRGKIRLKHYSMRIEQSYTDWIKRFIRHFGKNMKLLGWLLSVIGGAAAIG